MVAVTRSDRNNGTKAGIAPVFRRLKRKKAYEEVADEIRNHILGQRLEARHRLPTEREFAEQFGVSRTAVREAIRTLELTGLLVVKKGSRGGIFVARDYDRPIHGLIANLLAGGGAGLEDLFKVRELIEPYAAFCAATQGVARDFERLASLIEQAEHESAQGKHIRSHNIEFHRQVIRMVGNPILSVVGETVLVILSDRIRHITSPETSDAVLSMHKKLLAALRGRRPERARALMAKDIQVVGARLGRMQGRTQGNRANGAKSAGSARKRRRTGSGNTERVVRAN